MLQKQSPFSNQFHFTKLTLIVDLLAPFGCLWLSAVEQPSAAGA
jgi:hypothetical protein